MVSEHERVGSGQTYGWTQIDWFIWNVLSGARDQQLITEEQRHALGLLFKDAHDQGAWM